MWKSIIISNAYCSRIELVLAIFRRNDSIQSMDIPNTGKPRSDVLMLMNWFVSRFLEMGKDVVIGMLSDTATGYHLSLDLQNHIHESNLICMSVILEQAVGRGEARADISAIIFTLPIDLLRAEMLISREIVTQSFLEKIVDEIFLPLVRI
ncbi:TetR-like C-terminal domain-containing protein [Clostridium sp. WILCCON 0269]|uniref:TetR-like C-terminal domain-containing protein n=1 Tax=Candidatus Clostridium eludens TaxID=3381663 RepID=A0ABW8SK93_9CLOT